MAIILDIKKEKLTIDSKTIIGVMGKDYDKFLSSLVGNDIFYLDKKNSVSNKKVSSLFNLDDNINNAIKEFELKQDFLNNRVYELSHSEEKILKYLLFIASNKKILVIDEPFMDLDYENKKKIILLINKLYKNNKTVIIGSTNSNVIYSICKKILLLKDDYYYGDIKALEDEKILDKYEISMPNLVEFTKLAKSKNIKLKYSNDIRDLIKDVYRNVSQK